MPLTVDHDDPPAYCVHLTDMQMQAPDGEPLDVTLPFATLEDAAALYAAVIESGRCSRTIKQGKKGQEPTVLHYVSLWRRGTYTRVDNGQEAITYREVHPDGTPVGQEVSHE